MREIEDAEEGSSKKLHLRTSVLSTIAPKGEDESSDLQGQLGKLKPNAKAKVADFVTALLEI